MTGEQAPTVNCTNCHTTHFYNQLLDNNCKCTSCGTYCEIPHSMQTTPQLDHQGNPFCVFCKDYVYNGWHRNLDCPKNEKIQKLYREALDKKQSELMSKVHNINERMDSITKRIISIENFIGQNYKRDYDALHTLVMGFENNFAAIPQICERLDHLTLCVSELNPGVDMSIHEKLGSLSPETFGVLLKRIEDLEESYQGLSAELRYVMENTIKTDKSLKNKDSDLWDRVKKLEDLVDDIRKINNVVLHKYQKIPHKCPCCSGEGKRQVFHTHNPFTVEPFEKVIIDSQGRHFIACNSCDSKGIVWG